MSKPWLDILMDAAREAGFADRMSAHYLATFSKAIRDELDKRVTVIPPGTEVVPEGFGELEEIVLELETKLGAIANATRDDAWIRGRASLAKGVLHHVVPRLRSILTRHPTTETKGES